LTKFRSVLTVISNKLAIIAMAVTFILVFITTIDVALRKITNTSIRGSFEITEMGMVVIVFIALSYLQLSNGHIRVDMFVNKLPGRLRYIVDAFVLFVSFAVVIFIGYAGLQQTIKQFTAGITTGVVFWPLWPFVAFMTIGLVLYSLVLLSDGIDIVIRCARYKKPIEKACD